MAKPGPDVTTGGGTAAGMPGERVAGHPVELQIPDDPLPGEGQPFGHGEDAIVLGLVTVDPPLLVIDVLLATFLIAPNGLYVAIVPH